MFELSGYLGLFPAAFGAATLLPMQSEAVLAGLLLTERYAAWELVALASLGNVLGLAGELAAGPLCRALSSQRWFPVNERQLARAQPAITATAAGPCCSVGCRSSAIR